MLGRGQLKHEIGRKTLLVPLDLLIELFYRNAVELGQIRIQKDLVITDEQNSGLDGNRQRRLTFGHDPGILQGPSRLRLQIATSKVRGVGFQIATSTLGAGRTRNPVNHQGHEGTRREILCEPSCPLWFMALPTTATLLNDRLHLL